MQFCREFLILNCFFIIFASLISLTWELATSTLKKSGLSPTS